MSLAIQNTPTSAASVFGAAKSVTANTDTTGTAATAAGNNTITATDFMTLLVTEMKNQDPTQPTDPTQYVQQLVGVNSLQQLIGINQGVTSLTTPTTTSTSTPKV